MALRVENTQLKETKVRHESQLTNLEQELVDTRNQLEEVSLQSPSRTFTNKSSLKSLIKSFNQNGKISKKLLPTNYNSLYSMHFSFENIVQDI